jgi:hypothetical protein
MPADLFGLERSEPRHLDRKEAAALAEVLQALRCHPAVAWVQRMNTGAVRIGALAQRANVQEHMPNWLGFMKMALKAQGQCRATLQTLGELKNPRPVAFVKQANIANGPQQVNNGSASTPEAPPTAAAAVAPAVNPKTAASELLEVQDGERLDFSATSKAGAGNSDLAPVGALDRAAHA